ncbi:MAG: hypothetical protein SP1CHLAM54_07370 [Chlamydiia bacterium]|nr:hypothetical protein [Chlamydiia bacterium]MCH9615643.1 hypothetical protein [Chlamydiia bacterium]MCH9628954.1 hypothetical protein [Chlamydiia bacterium]
MENKVKRGEIVENGEILMQGYRAPLDGFKAFVTRPFLWFGPLLWSLLTVFLLAALFFVVMVKTWPTTSSNAHHILGVLKAFGYGMFAVLLAWIVVFPFVLAIAFEGMLGKFFLEKRISVQSEGVMRSIQSAIFITWKTLLIRLSWGGVTILSIWFMPPLGIFITNMAIAHIALLDGSDLALSMVGRDRHFRLDWIKRHSFRLFMGAFVGGILSLLLSITMIGWLFFLPGMYLGAAMLVIDD